MSFSTSGGYDPAQVGPIPPVPEVEEMAAEAGAEVEDTKDTAQDLLEGSDAVAAISDPANEEVIERLRRQDR